MATVLNEIARRSNVGMLSEETEIPVHDAVRGACELLSLAHLYVTNEGKLVAIVPEQSSQTVVDEMRRNPLGKDARVIGCVVADHPGMFAMKTEIGGTQVVDTLFGEQLPDLLAERKTQIRGSARSRKGRLSTPRTHDSKDTHDIGMFATNVCVKVSFRLLVKVHSGVSAT